MFSFLSSFYYAIFGGFRIDETTTLSKEQQRKLLLSGVFSAQKGTFMNVVKTGMSYGGRQKMFGQGWGITDKESAIDTLDYLQHAGTRRFFPLVVEALKLQNKRAIQQYITENLEDEEDMRDCQNIQTTVQESVVNYARKAKEAGLDGVVCSALEVELIKAATADDFLCVTPGIRPAGAEIGDQKRVMTPQEAHQIGSNYIVVGRPIIQAENPWDAYHEIKKQWNS